MNKITQLIGKTIEEVQLLPYPTDKAEPVDDGDYLKIIFTDKSWVVLVAGFSEDWTGNSDGEYPTYLAITLSEEPSIGIYNEQDRTILSDESNIEQSSKRSTESTLDENQNG